MGKGNQYRETAQKVQRVLERPERARRIRTAHKGDRTQFVEVRFTKEGVRCVGQ